MSNAVKRISVERGHDVTDYVLTTFGGAGGQHACAVADALGIRTVLIPPMAGVLSALGIGLADTTVMREQAVEIRLGPQTSTASARSWSRSRSPAPSCWRGGPGRADAVVRRAHLRYDRTDNALAVELADLDAMVAAFEATYRTTYSFLLERPLIVEAISVEATGLTGSRISHWVIRRRQPGSPETVRSTRRVARRPRSIASGCGRETMVARRSSPRPTPRPSSTTVGGRR